MAVSWLSAGCQQAVSSCQVAVKWLSMAVNGCQAALGGSWNGLIPPCAERVIRLILYLSYSHLTGSRVRAPLLTTPLASYVDVKVVPSGSMCLATDPSRSRAVGEVVIARRPAQVAQDVSICSPYRVQAQESE